ncbi:MAG: rRNA synthase [Candidatus Binataceae bacterium]|nr:rRNA synthase [Candidatus Binataceae bacterium]
MQWLIGAPLGLSRKRAKDLLRFRAVHVQIQAPARDGSQRSCESKTLQRVRHDTQLEPGDVVTIELHKYPVSIIASAGGPGEPGFSSRPGIASEGRRATAQRLGLKIVFLDDAIVVIDKPAGLLSMGSAREKEKTAHRILNDALKQRASEQQAFIVHRLDRETSGLMLFARSLSIQALLQQNWKTVIKRYLAVVEGVPSIRQGTLTDFLVESKKSLRVHRVEHGREVAITHYRVVEECGARSLVELTLETGRKHQIRVQLAVLGHPVAGDNRYGTPSAAGRRLALHSCELKFRHPVTDAPMEFRSALPTRLRQLL